MYNEKVYVFQLFWQITTQPTAWRLFAKSYEWSMHVTWFFSYICIEIKVSYMLFFSNIILSF